MPTNRRPGIAVLRRSRPPQTAFSKAARARARPTGCRRPASAILDAAVTASGGTGVGTTGVGFENSDGTILGSTQRIGGPLPLKCAFGLHVRYPGVLTAYSSIDSSRA